MYVKNIYDADVMYGQQEYTITVPSISTLFDCRHAFALFSGSLNSLAEGRPHPSGRSLPHVGRPPAHRPRSLGVSKHSWMKQQHNHILPNRGTSSTSEG